MTYRILITGSRTWDDLDAIYDALDAAIAQSPSRDVTVVHGACPRGADRIAAEYCTSNLYVERLGKRLVLEPHPANWSQFGKLAGPFRNQDMVDLGADVCLAFIKNGSRGASHCARRAKAAGIEVREWTA